MRRRRKRGRARGPTESDHEQRPDPLQAAVDRYSYRADSPGPDWRPADRSQESQGGLQWNPVQESPASSYPDQPSYRGRHSEAAQEPVQRQEPDQAPQPYPGWESNYGQPASPGAGAYPSRQPHPEQRFYPAQQHYPGQGPDAGMPSSEPLPHWTQRPAAHQPPAARQPTIVGQRQPSRPRWWRRRAVVVLGVVAVLLAAAAAAGGGYLLLRTKGSPQQTAAAYLRAWQQHNYHAMAEVSVDIPKGGLVGPLTRTDSQLGVVRTKLKLGKVTASSGQALARFTVTDDLSSNHDWTYQGRLRLVDQKRRWWVKWSPAAIYPGLMAGQRFTLTSTWPPRAQIYGADGTVLSSPAAAAQSGSIALLTGVVADATAAQAKRLGAPYKAGDLIGLGGIEQAYQGRLAGSPALTIKIAGPGKGAARPVHSFSAVRGRPVKTSIMMSVQLAASQAVLSSNTKKPIDMVVIQPSTGKILAMVERPGSWDKAIDGTYPPGSTFKIVTASALAKTGMTPSSQVSCPSHVTIGGYTIHNDKNEQLGTTTLLKAFAISCNTTFAELAKDRLSGSSLAAMARLYGFNTKPALGIPAQLGSFQVPHTPVDLAADAFGQGKDLVSPLSQAAEVAAVESGTWRPPLLVLSPRPKQIARPHPISPAILNVLRPMMHAVVTIGTAAGVGFPPGVDGKTGTAEYGTGAHPKAHGWFIGYRGDLAFAVLVEGGGYGASSAGPIANAFLHRY